ncbi:MAG: hypothetical protein M0T74_09590 [Desulfitobacterium hafniense]|nr:hypothetical protein [Desulfitobacterium hafniense]
MELLRNEVRMSPGPRFRKHLSRWNTDKYRTYVDLFMALEQCNIPDIVISACRLEVSRDGTTFKCQVLGAKIYLHGRSNENEKNAYDFRNVTRNDGVVRNDGTG